MVFSQVTQHITLALAKVLQVEVADIMPNERLSSYGIDSLMSYTFRNVLLSELQLDVPIVYLLQRASIGSLADKFVTQLNNPVETETKPKPTPKKAVAKRYGRQMLKFWIKKLQKTRGS
jgi:acyl carrier protein